MVGAFVGETYFDVDQSLETVVGRTEVVAWD